MPATETSSQVDSERDRDNDRGDRGERGGSKQKAASAASKAKDLSHVPCKFYKVGGCTAGSSCPFSHSAVEPGAQKETCAWFVKGNCKFGHKCALAHILPGQSMAMDRKNKKAAQAAAAAVGGGGGDRGKDKGGRKRDGHGGSVGGARNPLLGGGSTAPTRVLQSGGSGSSVRPTMMPLKASISPSAPAPPLKDTDFASFATLDEMEDDKLPTAPAQRKSTGSPPPEAGPKVADAPESADAPSKTEPAPEVESSEAQSKTAASSTPLPPSAPRTSSGNNGTDFGPIGSPPGYRTSQQTSPSRVNGAFSPGTSPRGQSNLNGVDLGISPSNPGFLSSSPFSAPGSQSVFLSTSYNSGGGGMSGGIAASLSSGLAMMGGGRKGWGDQSDSGSIGSPGFSMMPSQVSSSVTQQRPAPMSRGSGRSEYGFEFEEYGGGVRGGSGRRRPGDVVVEDGDMEDFIPGSLTDLLTPEERSRRMSRSNSGQGPATGLSAAMHSSGLNSATGSEFRNSGNTPDQGGLGHRYSRSVPAPSLLGDIKSIWADTAANPLPASPAAHPSHRGAPSSSLTSRFDAMNVGGGTDDMGLSMSMGSTGAGSSVGMMSPSNASAAFLPGLHHHYMSSKVKQAQQQASLGLGVGGLAARMRGTSGPAFQNNSGLSNNSIASNYLQPLGENTSGFAGVHTHTHGNTQHTYRTTPSPFDLTQGMHQRHPQTARGLSSHAELNNNPGTDDALHGTHLSPNARALQAHAPGQSLPQGLAAGYSRIHALPPLTNLVSPGTPGTFGTGTSPGAGISSSGPYGEWSGPASPPAGQTNYNPNVNSNNGISGSANAGSTLDSMFSRLSYSAAATRGGTSHPSPPGLSRNVSGGRHPSQQQQPQGALSPLSGPVVTRDDDDLFDMDG
ncbi:hypothetical protein BDQ12DRAFT_684403 [Crucibulum laeve]|uniref:C3H1-type domain-containing protein n=1 Tax=Crucibulum laeve TaxID=68775 RepID=A0A5C3M0U4_9AGAR|nr:hypothetical protein BDQ12DRAFT_684403 [Crucibulum laeve]